MLAMNRLFHMFRAAKPAENRARPDDPRAALERARALFKVPAPAFQTPEAQAGVRSRMEAELDEQREHRAHTAAPSA